MVSHVSPQSKVIPCGQRVLPLLKEVDIPIVNHLGKYIL